MAKEKQVHYIEISVNNFHEFEGVSVRFIRYDSEWYASVYRTHHPRAKSVERLNRMLNRLTRLYTGDNKWVIRRMWIRPDEYHTAIASPEYVRFKEYNCMKCGDAWIVHDSDGGCIGEKQYSLMVSRDCGLNYREEATGTKEALLEKGAELDKQMLRWTIQDDAGEIMAASAIHRGILATVERAREEENALRDKLEYGIMGNTLEGMHITLVLRGGKIGHARLYHEKDPVEGDVWTWEVLWYDTIFDIRAQKEMGAESLTEKELLDLLEGTVMVGGSVIPDKSMGR
jgi:hypothetical protein